MCYRAPPIGCRQRLSEPDLIEEIYRRVETCILLSGLAPHRSAKDGLPREDGALVFTSGDGREVHLRATVVEQCNTSSP